MIRETKVGLVVTCSFLGLLGVVVTSKLNEKKANAGSVEVADASRADTSTSESTPKEKEPTSKKVEPPKRLPPGVEQTKFEQPGPFPETKEVKTPSEPAVPLPPMTEKIIAEPPVPPMTEKTEPKTEVLAPAPPMIEKTPEPTPPPMPMSAPLPPPVSVTAPMVEPMKETIAVPLPPPEPEVKEKEKVPEPTLKLIPASPASPAAALPPEGMKESTPPVPEPAPVAPAPMVEVPVPTPVPVPAPPMLPETKKEIEESKEPKKDIVPVPGLPVPPPAPETAIPAPPVAPPVTPMTTPLPTPTTPEKPIAIPSPEEIKVAPPETTAPPVAPTSPMPVTPPMTVPAPSAPVKTPMETGPVSPAPAIVARTEPRAATTSEPPVDRFVEEDYKVKAGENFASISKNRYGSEEYAEALAQYNRNDALREPPQLDKDGSLRPGQVVSLPDLNFLEKRYGKFVPHLKAADTAKPAVPSPTSKGPSYQVPGMGQTMREIARLTLGNGERWKDIYHLNAQYRPDYAVPGGTVLTLPVDAKVIPTSR